MRYSYCAIVMICVASVAAAEDVVNYGISNSEQIEQYPGAILYSVPTRDKIAYVAYGTGTTEVHIVDINTKENDVVVSGGVIDPWRGLAISPDQQYVLYTKYHIPMGTGVDIWRANIATHDEELLLSVTDFVPGVQGEATDPTITCIVNGDNVRPILCVTVWQFYYDGAGIEGVYAVDIDPSGTPKRVNGTLAATKLVGRDRSEPWWFFRGCALSPLGDKLALVPLPESWHTHHNICIMTGVDALLAGDPSAEPVTTRADPRWHEIESTTITAGVSWSRNGSLTYSQEIDGETSITGADGEFQAKLVLFPSGPTPSAPVDIEQGSLSTGFIRSPDFGGTWFSFMDYDFDATIGTLRAGSLKLDARLDLDDGVRTTDFSLDDTSGMVIHGSAGTVGSGGGANADGFSLSVYTPISFREEIALTSGAAGIALVRRFEPAGLSFDPPLEVTIRYDPREVEGIPEDELHIVLPVPRGEWQVLDVLERNPASNTIKVALPSFPASSEAKARDTHCSLVMGAFLDSDNDGVWDIQDPWPAEAAYSLDTDNDGIADEWETLWFGPTTLPGEDPLQMCTPDSDPDEDGISNLQEFYRRPLGFSPLEANHLPSVGLAGLIVVILCVIVAGRKGLQRSYNK